MNRRMVFKTVGQICIANAGLLVLPLIVALIYRDMTSVEVFLKSIVVALALGLIIILCARPGNRIIYAKESFVIVSLAWIVTSLIGALPFYFSKQVPSYVDALFETVSGFTTTGASILRNVTLLPEALLFWRSFTHWVGGMGVLVFVMAIIPVSDRSIHLMRAEMPGPIIGKLVPRASDTAKLLYKMYIVLTAVMVVFLLAGGMNLFESLVHAFGTAGTGGFGIKLDSIGSYSPYIQWVIAVFMLLFGINFNIFYLLLLRRFKEVFKSTEMWCYFIIVGVSAIIITANIYPLMENVADAIRTSFFQVSSIITTTGYATVDFDAWPTLSKGILLILMFFGGCAGSTAGGFKISRVVILGKMIRRELKKMIHPRSVSSLRFEGKELDDGTASSVGNYFAIYAVCFVLIFLMLCFEKAYNLETNITAAATCFNNVGPGFAGVGPMMNFSRYSDFSKIVLTIAMLLGRLEIFPLILTFSFSTWRKQ